MALKVLRGIVSDIAESGSYRIMVDESTDVSNIEQLVIFICWVDKEMTLCKKYIGLMLVAQTNADTIVVCIKDVLLRMILRIQDVCEQCYNECSPMTGIKNGVAATKSRKGMKNVCWHTATATHLILLSGIQ